MAFRCFDLTFVVALCCVMVPVYSQINTPCTPSMITTFGPCMNFITNSTTNGSSTPTSDCCNSLKSIMSSGTDCLCLLFTGNVPLQIPINRTLAISLPRACQMPGVPLQCKAAAAAPISPAGPAVLAPSPSPGSISTTMTPTSAPESNTTPVSDTTPVSTPTSTGVNSGIPTNTGSRPTVTPSPSSAASSYVYSPFVLVGTGATFIGYLLF